MKRILVGLMLLIYGCVPEKVDINDYKGYIVVRQYCGFDNIDGGTYILKSPYTHKLISIRVNIEFCSVYNVNDTIK